MDTAQGVGRERKGVHRPCWLRRAASLVALNQRVWSSSLQRPTTTKTMRQSHFAGFEHFFRITDWG